MTGECNLILCEKEESKSAPFFSPYITIFSFCVLCVLFPQILFKARDLDSEPKSQMVRGNHTQSCLLSGLRKYVLYEIQILAFTRIGDGVPSSPAVIERTKDDSKFRLPKYMSYFIQPFNTAFF